MKITNFGRSNAYANGIVYNSLNIGDKYNEVPKTIVIWGLGFNVFKDGNYHEVSRIRRDYNGEPIDNNIPLYPVAKIFRANKRNQNKRGAMVSIFHA